MARSVKQLYRTLLMLRHRIRDETCLDRFPKLLTADLVTIDVFDTALVRTLAHHDDVFALAAWRVVTRLGLGYNIGDLAADRRAAHRRALENAYAAGRKETTIENIYAHHPITDATIRAALLAEELATERDVCRANASILALFDSLTARGRRVSFLSDSPFPADFVSQLLSDAGYSGEFEVHVSSGFGTTKAHGNLYERVATKTGVSPAGMWHIGDNLESDVLRASEWGVTPLWYRPHLLKNRLAPADGSAASLARCVLVGTRAVFSKSGPATKRIGATIAGPVYLAFVQWLIEKLRRDPVAQSVLALRRDTGLAAFFTSLAMCPSSHLAAYALALRLALFLDRVLAHGRQLLFACQRRAAPGQSPNDRVGYIYNLN